MNAGNQGSISDEEIVRSLQKGDVEAMAELYARYYLVVFNRCLSFTKNGSDAGDLTQDVMLKIMERIGSFRGDSKFSTWLYAITSNYCNDFVRKQRKQIGALDVRSLENVECNPAENEEVQLQEMKARSAEQALQLMSIDDQELLIQKYQMNKSISELQETYKLSASAVKMRLMRAREKASLHYSKLAATAI